MRDTERQRLRGRRGRIERKEKEETERKGSCEGVSVHVCVVCVCGWITARKGKQEREKEVREEEKSTCYVCV